MSDLTKCQLTITLCLQSKNLRDQRLLLHSGFLVLRFYIAIKKAKYIYIYSKPVLIYCDSKGLKIHLGFWIHMLWIYSQKLKACTQLLPYKLQSHLRFLSRLQLKAERPSSRLGLVSWAQRVNTKLGEDLSGCLLTTAGGSRVTENRLSSRLIRRKLLLAVANIQKASTKNIIYFLRRWKSLSCERWENSELLVFHLPETIQWVLIALSILFSPFMPMVLIIFIHPSQINTPTKGLEVNHQASVLTDPNKWERSPLCFFLYHQAGQIWLAATDWNYVIKQILGVKIGKLQLAEGWKAKMKLQFQTARGCLK